MGIPLCQLAGSSLFGQGSSDVIGAAGFCARGFSETGYSETGFSETGFSETGFSETGMISETGLSAFNMKPVAEKPVSERDGSIKYEPSMNYKKMGMASQMEAAWPQ